MNDLIPGGVHLLFSGGAMLDTARSGQVQVLGYTGGKQAPIAPEVQTIAEGGVPGFNVVSWYGFFVPLKTPTEIVTRLNNDTIAALADPSVQGRLVPLGYESRSARPWAQRYWIEILRPSLQPSSRNRCTKAPVH